VSDGAVVTRTKDGANRSQRLVRFADFGGTFVFAVEGATAAIRAGLDFFGVMVLSFATALAGGVLRDLLIGAAPPASIRNWRYPVTAFIAGAFTFCFHTWILRIPYPVIIGLDAAGLSLFAVAGTEKALEYGISPFVAALMGTVTGVGGGTIRDIFLAQVPAVLRSDIYATAALAGALVMLAFRRLKFSPAQAGVCGGLVCFLLRVVSVWRHWNLPRVVAP
jgi:uncharacterized membrane protein YeiH